MQETLWGEQRTQYPHAPANATNGHAVTAVAHARGNARTRAAHLRVRLQRILELTQVEHRQLARPPLDPFADARGNCRRRSCSAAGWTQAPEQRGEQSSEDGGPIVIDAADVRALASCVRPSSTPCKHRHGRSPAVLCRAIPLRRTCLCTRVRGRACARALQFAAEPAAGRRCVQLRRSVRRLRSCPPLRRPPMAAPPR